MCTLVSSQQRKTSLLHKRGLCVVCVCVCVCLCVCVCGVCVYVCVCVCGVCVCVSLASVPGRVGSCKNMIALINITLACPVVYYMGGFEIF